MRKLPCLKNEMNRNNNNKGMNLHEEISLAGEVISHSYLLPPVAIFSTPLI